MLGARIDSPSDSQPTYYSLRISDDYDIVVEKKKFFLSFRRIGISVARYKRLICFSIVFIIGGILHVFLREVDFTSCFSQLFYGIMVLVWGILVSDQIIDKRVRRLSLGIVLVMELYFVLEICRYRLADNYNRPLWYSYYIPMLVIPLLFCYLTHFMNRQEDETPNPRFVLASIPAMLLIPLIMTNDYHQLFVRLDDTLVDSIVMSNAGVLVYIYWVYSISILVSAFIVLFYKCQISISKRKIFHLIIILGVCIFLLLSYASGLGPSINGVKLWNIGEIFAFVSISILEASMQIGLISVNTKYSWIFQETNLPAAIQDSKGEYIYLTKGAGAILNPQKEALVQSSSISGGIVSWSVDLSAVNELNRQITATIDQIDARNQSLTIQNKLKEEAAAINARNKVYDRMAEIVSSQLGQIEKLLAEESEDFSQRLKKIVVYNAYIKRRSNFELLRESEEIITARELYIAISESIDYLKLNQIDVSFNFDIEGDISVDAAIQAYDFFENVVEIVLESASTLVVNLTEKNGTLSLRMLTDIKTENDTDSVFTLLLDRGGEEV